VSVTPERRFLGLEVSKPDDRTLLGLPPEGPLKSGQIEGALEVRADTIARHPLSTSAEARRLLAQLELAADRLQAEIALAGKGPLHPTAARRAAARMRARESAVASQQAAKATVVAPKAIAKPRRRLRAAPRIRTMKRTVKRTCAARYMPTTSSIGLASVRWG